VTFRSLRWRIASFYALLLLGVIAVVALVLTVQLKSILLDEAQAKVDIVGRNISDFVQDPPLLSASGDRFAIEEALTNSANLDHWSSPTTFVQIDTPSGEQVGKSSNMGGATFAGAATTHASAVVYRIEDAKPLGLVLVRDEYITTPSVSIIAEVAESLAIYDATVRRIQLLLSVVVVLAALAVVAGSYAIASSAIDPINRLIVAMGEIRSDRLSRRLGWPSREDELGKLAQSFDAMLDRLEEGFARERQFISDASHELKTPLTVINANAQMLERWADREPDVRADSLRAIREESGSLAAMVNGMLLLAKAESGDDIPRQPVELPGIVAEAVRGAQPRADEKGLTLDFEGSGSDVRPLVLGDANLLRQLFTNLIDNAIKFTERGGIVVELTVGGGHAEVTVLDTGPGLDEDVSERIFDRFYRADASRDRSVPGTGLGLAIVRSIARVHDGTVSASRRAGGGSAFRVTLPTLTSLS
jgi:heavy metal sensor kinase